MLEYRGFYKEEVFHSILSLMAERGFPDLYLVPYNYPILRDSKDHNLYEINFYFKEEYPILTQEDITNIVSIITKKEHIGRRELDTSYSLEDKAYFRVHITSTFGNLGIVMRNIPAKIPSLSDLSFSPEVYERLKMVCDHKDGLVLVTGPTGSGKSTTLSAMIKEMRDTRSLSIVTIEDPVEFVHKPKEGENGLSDIVIQQQVGIDVPSFYDGIVASLRKHPNVILLGEIRGKDEMDEAIIAANTGHLVLATLHTRNAIQTIERIITLRQNISKADAYKEIASVMRAFISQQLTPKIGGGFIPVCEILANTPYVADIIEKGANFMEMKEALDGKTRSPEIISLNEDLFNRWQRKEIERKTALGISYNKVDLDLKMRKFGLQDKEKKEEEEEAFGEKGF
ncbi:MAG: ATPase, T2SS/T4P/T4SS family [bacterium]